MPWASFSLLDGPGGTGCDVPVRGCWVSRDVIVAAVYDCVFDTSQPVPPGPSSNENDAHGIKKLLLKTQVSLTSFLQSEVKIIHIIVQNNTYYNARSRWTKQHINCWP